MVRPRAGWSAPVRGEVFYAPPGAGGVDRSRLVNAKDEVWTCSQCGHAIDHYDTHARRELRQDPYVVCNDCTAYLRAVNRLRPLGDYDYEAARPQAAIDPRTLAKRCEKHRITPERFMDLLTQQRGRCAICNHRPPRVADFVIDHNHDTLEVRGLLCGKCNSALGLFRDSPDVLEAALEYLEQRGCYGPNALAEEAQ